VVAAVQHHAFGQGVGHTQVPGDVVVAHIEELVPDRPGHGPAVGDGEGGVALDIGGLVVRAKEVGRIEDRAAEGHGSDGARRRDLQLGVVVVDAPGRSIVEVADDAEVQGVARRLGAIPAVNIDLDVRAVAEVHAGAPGPRVEAAVGGVDAREGRRVLAGLADAAEDVIRGQAEVASDLKVLGASCGGGGGQGGGQGRAGDVQSHLDIPS
jgi:hypothetical protein